MYILFVSFVSVQMFRLHADVVWITIKHLFKILHAHDFLKCVDYAEFLN